MGEMSVNMYDSVCQEDPDDFIENDELSETLPPCKECEKHFFYRKSTFNLFDGLFVLISMGTLVADIVTDTLVTVQYFKSPNPQFAWGSLTLAFTLGPSIVMQIFSASWYMADEDMTCCRWILHFVQLAPLQRYIRVFRTGLEARKSDDPLDFQRLHHQQSDVSMLRLFEAFLESAPQVVLQLYIMVATNDDNYFTGVSAMVSLFSLCWAMVAYSKNHRKVRNDKNIVSIPGLILQTIWRIGMISSRVVALVLFASVFQAYLFVVAAIHWLCMTIWVYIQNTDFCDTWIEERIFNAVIGVIYIFCFFNLKEGNSRYRVTFFYMITFGENVILVSLWYIFKDEDTWHDPVGFSVVFGGFAIGVSSMLLYYRFFHPRGSGAISLFKKIKPEDENRLHRNDRRRQRSSDGAEISRRSRTPTPKTSPHKQHGSSPLAYPIPSRSRSLTPCKYSPLKSEGKLPYDRYGMRRPHRSQSEACIDVFGNSTVTPAPRMGSVHSEHLYSQHKSAASNVANRSQSEACIDVFGNSTVTPAPRINRVQSEHLYSQNKSATSNVDFEFSGFATALVKRFDKKMDQACASAMSNYSYGSYGFDVEAQQRQLQYNSAAKSEHQVMVHASASQPDMRRAVMSSVSERDESSILLEPMPETIDTQSKIKSAYEVQQIYHGMLGEEQPKRSSKRQLRFGQSSRSPSPIKNRTPSPMCPLHQQMSAHRANTLPSNRQKAWQICEILAEPQQSQKVKNTNRGPPPKIPPRADLVQNSEIQTRLKIPQDTSKAERAMLKCGEKRKFSFREKVPAASLKAMRFTPKAAPVTDASSPLWKLRDLNARLWQPKTVDIYNPKLNQSPGKPKLVAQKRYDSKSKLNNQATQVEHRFSFNSDSTSKSSNLYTMFGPSSQTKATAQTKRSVSPASNINNGSAPSSNHRALPNIQTATNQRNSFEFGITNILQSSLNSSNMKKPENIYATIDENDTIGTVYTDLEAQMNNTCETKSSVYQSSGRRSGSGGKKRKLSPRADLPQLELKLSQQSAQPVTPLTPTKSYRLADRDIFNSPHRHLSSSSNRSKSRLNMASNQKESTTPVLGTQTEVQPITVCENTQSNSKACVIEEAKQRTDTFKPNQVVQCLIDTPVTGLPQPKQEEVETKSDKMPQAPPSNMSDGKKNILPQQQRSSEAKSEEIEKAPKTSSSREDTKTRSPIEKQSAMSSSMPTITNSQTQNNSLKSRNVSLNPEVLQRHNDSRSSDISKKNHVNLEKQSGKSQSLPEIASSKETSQLKKGIKPKAHSDTRGNCIKPQTSLIRKPLAQLQNGSNTFIPKVASTSNKTSSNERLESKLLRSHDLSDKTNVSRKPRRISPIEKIVPLMQSTPALPDCRKLLRFESTGAKPKVTQQNTDIKNSSKTKKKPLSPVENNSDENQSTPVVAKSRSDVNRTIPNSAAPVTEARLRDRIGRYDPDILRSGKENQHLAIAKMFDVLSPTDSFISSLAFQTNFERRIPPKKPPRMSLSKIPSNTVSDNVAKFSNGTDL